MKNNKFSIILTTTLLAIVIMLTVIYLTTIIWNNEKITEFVYVSFIYLSENDHRILNILQAITSVAAILLASYALTKDSIRDKESSIRYKKTIDSEKKQHDEIIQVYNEQKEILSKYKESSDLILEQVRKQAKTTELQFENQKILTQPGVNINFQANDQLDTNLVFEDDNYIMPEVIVQLHNFGGRIAKSVKTKIKFISPNARMIHDMNEETEPYLYPKAIMLKYNYPIINLADRDFFMLVIYFEWIDEFDDNKEFKKEICEKFIRNDNGSYTAGKANGAHLEIISDIIENPEKTVVHDPVIREYMFNAYNK